MQSVAPESINILCVVLPITKAIVSWSSEMGMSDVQERDCEATGVDISLVWPRLAGPTPNGPLLGQRLIEVDWRAGGE